MANIIDSKFLLLFSEKVCDYHNICSERKQYIIDTLDKFIDAHLKHDLFDDLDLLKGKFGEYHEYMAVSQILTACCIYNKCLCSGLTPDELLKLTRMAEERSVN